MAAMRKMKSPGPEPRRNFVWQESPLGGNADAVSKSAAFPLQNDSSEILPQSLFVSSPHQNRGMMFPGGSFSREDIQNLHGFDALFAQATVV
jgi:hypothetical protein